MTGVCTFVIDYEEALHRFPKRCANAGPSMMTGVVAASFCVALIVVLVHWA